MISPLKLAAEIIGILLFLQRGLVVFNQMSKDSDPRKVFNLFYRGRTVLGLLAVGSGAVQVLECETCFHFFPFRCPLVSLSYIPRAASAAFPYGGVLAGTLENASFWELRMGFSHWPHVLPMEPGGCVDFQTESSTRHCLVTYRPGECWDVLVGPPVVCLGADRFRGGQEVLPYPSGGTGKPLTD